MRCIHPASAVIATTLAITAGIVAGGAYADSSQTGAAVANPTQQQALDANETMRNYILAHPSTPTPAATTPVETPTATPTETATEAPAGQKYASGMPWSDGGFFEHSGSNATAFAAWRGAPLDNVVAFTTRSSWSALLNNWWTASVPTGFDAARDDFILSVPLWTDDGSAGSDQNWRDLGTEIAAVDPNGLVRLGWEMNCCFSHATNADTWRDQFSRAVTLMRSSAPGLQIVFNPNEGGAQNGTVQDIESLYVQGKVDIIALDTYDWWSPFTTKANIDNHFTKAYGWDYWFRFARRHHLPFALGEFSVSSGSSASGGDNPRFFQAVYGWLTDREKQDPGSIRFVALFNDSAPYCGCAISDSQNPRAAAEYKSLIARIARIRTS